MTQVDSMIGHNAGGTALHRLRAAVATLALALKDARVATDNNRQQMVIVARALLAVDEAAAEDESLADAEIKSAGITSPTDLIAGENERTLARWMARGGVRTSSHIVSPKNTNAINDLSGVGLNGIEGAFLTKRKFAKTTSYVRINSIFAGECKSEIRKTLGGEGSLSLDGIRGTYAGTLFLAETVEGWIRDAEYRLSEEYEHFQMLRRAASLSLKDAETNNEERQRLMDFHKDQIKQLMKVAADQRAEAEAKRREAEAPKVTAEQRRRIEDSIRRGEETGISRSVTDEDF